MEINRSSEKGKLSGSKKYSTSVKDVKRKLLCINKRISELQHQRKSVYKNSVKVKKMVHNQINQIVKHFRARERIICSDVDEVYFSQDANINSELSRLQSVYAHCQALFNHIEDFKEKSDVLRNIDATLSEINSNEKPDVKPLEFVSDFEMMKVKADSYGCLEGDFVKNDFVYVGEEIDKKLSDENCKLLQDKEFLSQNSSTPKKDSNISTQKSSLCKISDNDDFQIIDLLDNMSCQDIDDFIMDDDVNLNCTPQNEKKLNDLTSNKNESTFITKMCNISSSSSERHTDFDPEEEWRQIVQMNKKIASWRGMTSKETESNIKEKETSYNTNCNPCRFSLSEEANYWLHALTYDKSGKKEISDKITPEINSMSPAKVIQTSFKSYLVKDNIHNWLSTC